MFKALLTILIWIMIVGIASAVQDPFLVYGYVKYDNGSVVDGATVNISVPDQALAETTNSMGKYIGVLDMYQNGDEIIVTTVKGLYTGSAADILDKSSGGLMINVTMQDTGAPRSITSLQSTVGNFWINWTWTNPDDSDFGYSEVYIDNVWTANVSDTYYNGSYPAHSIKTISIKTVDLNGNVNNTWMNQTTAIPNNPVLLTNISSSLTTAEGQTVYIDADAIDADGDSLTYSASGLPAGASFNTASGAFSWTPEDGQAGTYVVTFEVTDGYINDSEAVAITVSDANHAPVMDSIGAKSVDEENTLAFTIFATDPDSDPLTYSATDLPTGATFNSTTRTFSWTPDETQAGSYQVHFEVTDGSLSDAEDVTITVNDAQKPIITNVNAASITDTSATGKWNTDEPSDSLVKYGTVSGVYTAEVYNAADVVSHSIQPTGLSPHTTYYYVVNSTDPNGNSNESVEYDFTTESQDITPTSVTYPTATPSIIPDDTDNDPRWGESSQLNVTITDDDGIASVTIDLSAIGGSSVQHMTNIGGNIWSVNTSAAAGTSPQTYDLRVNATDIYGYSNTSVVISLMVVKNGDITGDGKVDFKGDVIYLKKHIRGVSGYEALIEEVADVTGDGRVDFAGDVVYLARHTKDVPGYEILH